MTLFLIAGSNRFISLSPSHNKETPLIFSFSFSLSLSLSLSLSPCSFSATLSSCVFKIVTQPASAPHRSPRFLGAVGVLYIIASTCAGCELFAGLTLLHCLF